MGLFLSAVFPTGGVLDMKAKEGLIHLIKVEGQSQRSSFFDPLVDQARSH